LIFHGGVCAFTVGAGKIEIAKVKIKVNAIKVLIDFLAFIFFPSCELYAQSYF